MGSRVETSGGCPRPSGRRRQPGTRMVSARDGDARGPRSSRDPTRVRRRRDGDVRLSHGQLGRGGESCGRAAAWPAPDSAVHVVDSRLVVRLGARARARHHHAPHRAVDADDQYGRPRRHHRSALFELVPAVPRGPGYRRSDNGVHGSGGASGRTGRPLERRVHGEREYLRGPHRHASGSRSGSHQATAPAACGDTGRR